MQNTQNSVAIINEMRTFGCCHNHRDVGIMHLYVRTNVCRYATKNCCHVEANKQSPYASRSH